ncbi:class I SAM-dependent methyltransferase [Agrobacterium rosae]|uniref:Class I SAM-dependent methyltransferase n=1 Tax=Agrobacterium rosae TaxID=1972867 RepID=A0AAW9FTE2_9HYPH|nr:class I SAM-dependent methyltransferase [Agrobacterium rosae]MDX8306033.1 class I SAM-dependent methyltransferase [Agrobacterium rosae]
MKLDELGVKFQTDKSSLLHNYLKLYERRLTHLVAEKFTLIEVGVFKGGSLATWAEYFPQATIVGVDIDPECKQFEKGNAYVRIGDASDSSFIFDVVKEFGKPTVVIDDGSHRWDHQIATLQNLFPILLPDGLFIIEDIHTSFEGISSMEPFQAHSSISCFDYLQKLSRAVTAAEYLGKEKPFDLFIADQSQWVSSVEFARKTAVLSKSLTKGSGPR